MLILSFDSTRSWEKGLYAILRRNMIVVYKDQKHYKTDPEKSHRGEGGADLKGATVSVPSDYTKKKHVFRLKLTNGGEYLFEARDQVRYRICLVIINVLTLFHSMF